jgi:hypothetical protein
MRGDYDYEQEQTPFLLILIVISLSLPVSSFPGSSLRFALLLAGLA